MPTSLVRGGRPRLRLHKVILYAAIGTTLIVIHFRSMLINAEADMQRIGHATSHHESQETEEPPCDAVALSP